jgi:uncharacterized membrane protein YfhO
VADSWDDGWSVKVDGRKADVLPADSAFRAVRLSTGEHYVRFSYEPAWFVPGVVISSVSLGIILGGIVLALWRRISVRRVFATGRKRNS